MSYESFKRIVGSLPNCSASRCRRDDEKGLFTCKSGEHLIIGCGSNNGIAVKNLRTGAMHWKDMTSEVLA